MEALLDSATIIPIAVVVARLVVPLFIPVVVLYDRSIEIARVRRAARR